MWEALNLFWFCLYLWYKSPSWQDGVEIQTLLECKHHHVLGIQTLHFGCCLTWQSFSIFWCVAEAYEFCLIAAESVHTILALTFILASNLCTWRLDPWEFDTNFCTLRSNSLELNTNLVFILLLYFAPSPFLNHNPNFPQPVGLGWFFVLVLSTAWMEMSVMAPGCWRFKLY